MLDLDWRTVLFQIINFGVLLVILNYLVFRPLRRKLNERSGAVADALQNARDQETEAIQLRADWETRMAEIEREREDILGQARREAEAKTAELYRETRERLDLITEQMRRDVRRQRSEVVSESYDEVLDTIIALSANVVQSVTTRRAHDDLITNLLAQIYQMPQDQVDTYRRVMAGRMPTAFVTTPVALSAEQARNLTDTVSSLADRHVELQVSVDPSLIAGIQVRLGDRLLDNSVRNQLGRVRNRVAQELVERLGLEG